MAGVFKSTVFNLNVFLTEATGGAQNVSPTGIASAEVFGAHVVLIEPTITPAPGIYSAEAWGTPIVATSQNILPFSFDESEPLPDPLVTQPSTANVSPIGIASKEQFGLAKVVQGTRPYVVAELLTVCGAASLRDDCGPEEC